MTLIRYLTLALRAVVFCLAMAMVGNCWSQGLERFLNGVAGVEVARGDNGPKEYGTGFVVSVDGATVSVLTARHLFYPGKEAFSGRVSVTFYVDKLHPYAATLLTDSKSLDVAVLKVTNVPRSIAQLFPTFSVRSDGMPLSIGETLHVFGGKSQSWQVSTDTISDVGDGDSTDGFRFDGNGIRGGFSGAPVLDAKGLLTGVHLGGTDVEGVYGRAMRIGKAYEVLSQRLGVSMNKLSFSGASGLEEFEPSRVASPPRPQPQGGDPKAGAVSGALSQPGTMERVAMRLGLRSDLKIQNASETLRWYQSAKALATNAGAFDQIAGRESPMLVGKITSVVGGRIRASEVMLRYLAPVLSFDIVLLHGQLDFEPKAGMYVAFRGTPISYSVLSAGAVECSLSVLPAHFLEVEPTF